MFDHFSHILTIYSDKHDVSRKFNNTTLHMAIFLWDPMSVSFLRTRGVDVNKRTVMTHSGSIFRLAIKRGIDYATI